MPDAIPPADLLMRSRRPHLVGVSGAAMRSLASLLLALGREVSGSDSGSPAEVARVAALGVRASHGHAPEHLGHADLVVISAAIPADNPELAAARARNIPVLTHAQALGALMATRDGIAVAGTHGKSTTTALVAHLLAVAGRDPTLAGGADALNFGGYARLGSGPELVAEADEYGRRFLKLHPRLAIITAVEPDHLDYYGSFEAVQEAFQQFVAGMAPDGVVVTCEDEPNLARLPLARRRIRYGWAGHADWRLDQFRPRLGGGGAFVVRRPDGTRESYEMAMTGRHQALNAVAALAIARELGVPDDAARQGIATFQGTRRRFETLAHRDGVWIVDDYAHHPTAVRANLNAARDVHRGRLVAVFQPHTTHRTATLLDGFAASFAAADRVIVAPIYQPAGRSVGPPEVTSEDLVARMAHPDAVAAASLDGAYDLARAELRPGTLVILLGAGDISTVASRLAAAVEAYLTPGSRGGEVASAVPGVLEHVPLGRYTSLRVGGPARWFLASDDLAALARLLDAAREADVRTLVLGGGTNLLVSDAGFDGVVVKYTGDGFEIEAGPDGAPLVRALAGTNLSNLARRLARDGFGGLEWAANVPGTVGGAVVNNAGAFGGCIADHLVDAEIVGPDGQARTLEAADLAYAYRTSTLKRGLLGPVLVRSARLRLYQDDPARATARVLELQAKRTASQPRQLSAGSIFANPPGDYAGRLIEAVGLKGERRGGAEISTHHANFIVNPGVKRGTTAADVLWLIRRAQDAVWERFGVWLMPEVQFVGAWDERDLAGVAGPATPTTSISRQAVR